MRERLGLLLGIAIFGISTAFSAVAGNEEDRARLEWQAAKFAESTLAYGSVPTDWDGGVFISNASIAQFLDQLKDTKITVDGNDIAVIIRSAALHAEPTFLGVELRLEASSKKKRVKLGLTVEAQLSYLGSIKVEKERFAQFRIVPIELAPSLTLLGVSLPGEKFASDLLTSGLLSLLLEAKPLMFPLPLDMEVNLEQKGTETLPVKGTDSKITVEYSMPKSILSWNVAAVAPVILKDGMWLLARGSGAETAPADPGATPIEALKAETVTIRKKVSVVASPDAGAQLWISARPMLDLARQFNELPVDQRTVHVQVVKVTGPLYRSAKNNALLGKTLLLAELKNPRDTTGNFTIGTIQPRWSAKQGISMSLSVDGDVTSKLHIHVDPGIGGGVGSVVRVIGNGSGAAAGSVRIERASLDGTPVLAALTDAECRNATIEAKSDGKVSTDWGWTKVVSVGVRQKILTDLAKMKPTLLIDGLPIGIAGRDKKGKPLVIKYKGRKVHVESAWNALWVVLTPRGVKLSDDGWQVGADVVVTAQSKMPPDQAKRRAELQELAVKRWPVKLCPKPDKTEILIGGWTFGPNNEIVKFLVTLKKLPEAAIAEAKRLGGELSTDKVKGWVEKPQESFEKSTPGQVVTNPGKAAKEGLESTKDKVNDVLGTHF